MSLQKLTARPETYMALILCGCVLPLVCTLMGFYLGTFVYSQHKIDLQGGDVDKGIYGGVVGFAISIFVLFGMLAIFPRAVDRDDNARAEHQSHPHFQNG